MMLEYINKPNLANESEYQRLKLFEDKQELEKKVKEYLNKNKKRASQFDEKLVRFTALLK